MIDLEYDGSFDGFLCAAARVGVGGAAHAGAVAAAGADARPGEPARISSRGEGEPDLFSHRRIVLTDAAEAAVLRAGFIAASSGDELRTLLYVHSSNHPDRHRLLLEYMRMTLAAGGPIGDRLSDPVVLAVRKTRARVEREIANLLGFARFHRVESGAGAGPEEASLWYAAIEPDANIVGFLGPHFADRFPDERLLLHDVGRDIGYCAVHGKGGIVDLSFIPESQRSALSRDCEPVMRELWREYFSSIAIPERRNQRLQTAHMPRRYWKHMTEME